MTFSGFARAFLSRLRGHRGVRTGSGPEAALPARRAFWVGYVAALEDVNRSGLRPFSEKAINDAADRAELRMFGRPRPTPLSEHLGPDAAHDKPARSNPEDNAGEVVSS